jgi:hypothetical protein
MGIQLIGVSVHHVLYSVIQLTTSLNKVLRWISFALSDLKGIVVSYKVYFLRLFVLHFIVDQDA